MKKIFIIATFVMLFLIVGTIVFFYYAFPITGGFNKPDIQILNNSKAPELIAYLRGKGFVAKKLSAGKETLGNSGLYIDGSNVVDLKGQEWHFSVANIQEENLYTKQQEVDSLIRDWISTNGWEGVLMYNNHRLQGITASGITGGQYGYLKMVGKDNLQEIIVMHEGMPQKEQSYLIYKILFSNSVNINELINKTP